MELELSSVIDALPGLVWTTLPDGSADFINKRWLDYTGLSAEQAIGWGWQAAVHPEDKLHLVEYWRARLASGGAGEAEARLRRFDGVYRWFHFHVSPVTNASGSIVKWCGINTDVEDRKRAEEETHIRERHDALQASERNLKQIIDATPALIWATRPDGATESLNKHYLDYVGLPFEQLVGWGWAAAIHPEDLVRLTGEWKAILESGKQGEAEARLRRYDGIYRWFLFRANPVRDETGNIIKWYGVNTDIEDRKQAEEAAAASELNLRRIIDTMPAFAWSARPDGSVDFMNKHYLEYKGTTLEEQISNHWSSVHPDDRERHANTWRNALATGTAQEVEARHRRRDGVYRWFLIRATPLRDETGHIVKWYGVNTDIEDRKKAEEAVTTSEGNLKVVIDTTPALIWTAGPDGRTESINQHYLDYVGLPLREMQGWGWTVAVHPDDRDSFAAIWNSLLATGTAGQTEARLRRHDGQYRWFLFRANPMRDEHGKVVKWYGVNTDIEDRRQAELTLIKVRSELAHVARVTSLNALTASIAHEVNQPLAGIITNASTCLRMLAAAPPNIEGARETARRTIRDGHRASEVITRLRRLFTKKECSLEPLDLNEAAQEVIALSINELQRGRISLRRELANDLPPVSGDRVQLQQVILNLILNASDAMAEIGDRQRSLVIRTKLDGDDHVRLDIEDSGVGIDTLTMSKLFDAFYTTKPGGMGVGLSVSRSIIENHQGRLWAQANDGYGATFSFSIPRMLAGNANLPRYRDPREAASHPK